MNEQTDELLAGLSKSQAALIRRVAGFLRAKIEETISTDSDLVEPDFADDFRNRLVLYHALNDDPLKKKAFEFAFAAASRAAGHSASVTTSSTLAGRDVEVDGVAFSCKTEAAQSIKRKAITISKLMEARWIRACADAADFRRHVQDRIVGHLDEYERIIVLRAFQLPDQRYEYHLVEIPRDLLLRVATLEDRDFSRRTSNGSSSADVRVDGRRAFRLRLDGSVEKVTISDLDVSLCRPHATWKLPVGDS